MNTCGGSTAITVVFPHSHTMRTRIMPPYRPSKSARHESSAQERSNERKSEEKQVERLLAALTKKLGPSGVQCAASLLTPKELSERRGRGSTGL
jgi:hypothetical protein